MGRYNYRLGSFRLEDANGLGLTVRPTAGDLSIGAENDSNIEKTRVLDRGSFDDLVETDDLVQDISITAAMENVTLTHATEARLSDFIRKQGSFKNAVTLSSNPRIWAFKAIATFSDGTTSTTKTFPFCKGTIALSEGNPENTFSIALQNFVKSIDA